MKSVRVEVELPGVSLEDINIHIKDDHVTISTRKSQSNKEKSGIYFLNERHFGNFYRRIKLPDYVDNTSVNAVLGDGVLKITMAKSLAGTQEKIVIKPSKLPQQVIAHS